MILHPIREELEKLLWHIHNAEHISNFGINEVLDDIIRLFLPETNQLDLRLDGNVISNIEAQEWAKDSLKQISGLSMEKNPKVGWDVTKNPVQPEKSCNTCKYIAVLYNEKPCRICMHNYDNWQPKL